MTKKNICFFNSSKTWGGGEKWHYDMAVGLNNHQFNSFVISGKKSELAKRLNKTKIPTILMGVSNFSFLNPLKIKRICNILKSRHIHTIIINLSEDLKIAGPAAKLAGVKNIIYRRGSAIPIKNSLSNRFLFKHVLTGIIANSEQTKRTILQNNPDLFPENKIKVIYNGIKTDRSDDNPVPPLYQRQPGEIVLGNAGRLVPQKGQTHLIDIAKNLKDRNIRFKLLIAGEGRLLNELQEKAKTQGVLDNIVFLGFVENIQRFMKTIDIFLLTSLWEGFGYVIVEAMAAGKPVIAFNVSSNPELIDSGETGYLIEKNEIRDFQKKIESLAKNRSLCEKMGKAGQEKAKNQFDIHTTIGHLKAFLNSIGAPAH